MSARQQIDKYPVFYFYLRRLFRIAPLFWVAMVVYWTFPKLMSSDYWLSCWAPSGVHPSYFILTALFIHGWHPYTFNSIVPGGWSITVEMTFYAFFPFIFRFLGHSLKKTIVAVLVSILYIKLMFYGDSVFPWLRLHLFSGIRDDIWDAFINLWFPSELPVFLIGFLAYHFLCNDFVKTFVKSRFWSGCLLCFCAMMLLGFLRMSSGFIPNLLMIVLVLAGIIIAISGGSLPLLVNPDRKSVV